MVARFADVGEKRAVTVIDQGVLLEPVGGQAADCRKRADRLRGHRRHTHQRDQDDDGQAKDQRPAKIRPGALSPAMQLAMRTASGR